MRAMARANCPEADPAGLDQLREDLSGRSIEQLSAMADENHLCHKMRGDTQADLAANLEKFKGHLRSTLTKDNNEKMVEQVRACYLMWELKRRQDSGTWLNQVRKAQLASLDAAPTPPRSPPLLPSLNLTLAAAACLHRACRTWGSRGVQDGRWVGSASTHTHTHTQAPWLFLICTCMLFLICTTLLRTALPP